MALLKQFIHVALKSLLYLVLVSSFLTEVKCGDWDSASMSALWSSDPLQPCVHQGEIYYHGDSWLVDRDTQCQCNNSEVICDVTTCPYLDCDDPIQVKGEQCILCYYNVIVAALRANITQEGVMTAWKPVTLTLDVEVFFEEFLQTTGVAGDNLWKLSLWGSDSADGGGTNRHGFVEQILDQRQSSKAYKKGNDFRLRGINYDLVPMSCNSVRYVCLRFGLGDELTTKSGLELRYSGADDDNSDITTCVAAPPCRDVPPPIRKYADPSTSGMPCIMTDGEHPHGTSWKQDKCTTCTCDNGEGTCVSEKCPRLYCPNPKNIPGRCCKACPYFVVAMRAHYDMSGSFDPTTGRVRHVEFDVTVTFRENKRSTGVKGKNLWKISAWGSSRNDGSGARQSYVDQILDDSQQSKAYVKGKDFVLVGVRFPLGTYNCNSLKFFCMSFGKGDEPAPKFGLGFDLRGLTPDDLTCIKAPPCRRPTRPIDTRPEEIPTTPPVVTTTPATTTPVTTTPVTTTPTMPSTTASTTNIMTTSESAGSRITTRSPSAVTSSAPRNIPQEGGQSPEQDTDNVEPDVPTDSRGNTGQRPGSGGDNTGRRPGRPNRPNRGRNPPPTEPAHYGPRQCVTRVARHEHGEHWRVGPCTVCQCNDATIRCIIRSCPPYFCYDPIMVPGECCPYCPLNVIVSGVLPVIRTAPRRLSTGQRVQLNLLVNVTFKLTYDTTGVSGANLWKLSIWTSRNADGSQRSNHVDQALTTRQQSQRYQFGKRFILSDIDYGLVVNNCQNVKYVCVKFDQADRPQTRYGTFYFEAFPDFGILTSCQRLPVCRT